MAESAGLLAMGNGVLAMGRTTLVTMVAAMRAPPRTCWAKVTGVWLLVVDSVMDREDIPGPPSPADNSSAQAPPLLFSSPVSVPLLLFLSVRSSAPPPPVPLAEVESDGGMEGEEEEEGREEGATGWKPCWREDGDGERSKPGKLVSSLLQLTETLEHL